MAFISGDTGDMSVGGTTLAVKSWSSDLEQDVIDTTNKSTSGWRTKALGLKQMTGTFDCDADTTKHMTGTFPFPFADSEATIVLSMTDGSNDGGSFSFEGIVSKLSFSSPVEGIISISGSYESSGVVTYTPPA